MDKEELLHLFEEAQKGTNENMDGIYQRLNFYSNSIQTLQIAREIFFENIANTNISYISLLMCKDVLQKRGAILSDKQLSDEINTFYELFSNNTEIISQKDIVAKAASSVLAFIIRIYVSVFKRLNIFENFKQFMSSNQLVGLYTILDFLQFINEKYQFDSNFDGIKDTVQYVLIDMLQSADITNEIWLKIVNMILNYLNTPNLNYWDPNIKIQLSKRRGSISDTQRRKILNVNLANILLEIIFSNPEQSALAAETLQYFLCIEEWRFEMNVKKEIHNLIKTNFPKFKEIITTDNVGMVFAVIYRFIYQTEAKDFITKESAEIIEILFEITKMTSNSDSLSIAIMMWAEISEKFAMELDRKKSDKFEKFPIFEALNQVFILFIQTMSSLDKEDLLEILSDPYFIQKYGNIWKIAKLNLKTQVKLFVENYEGPITQTSVMIALCSIFMIISIRNGLLLKSDQIYSESLCDILFHTNMIINKITETEFAEEDLPLIQESISLFTSSYLSQIFSNSQPAVKSAFSFLSTKYNAGEKFRIGVIYDIVHHLLLGMHRFPSNVNIVSNYIDDISKIISGLKATVNFMEIPTVMQHVNGEATLDVSGLDPFDQSFLYQKYFTMITQFIGKYDVSSLLENFHNNLAAVDVNNHLDCLIFLRRFYGFTSNANTMHVIILEFVTHPEHHQKFLAIVKSCGEHILLAQIVCEIYASLSNTARGCDGSTTINLVYVHCCFELLGAVGSLTNSEEKFFGAIQLIESMICGNYVNYAAMRFFGDNMINDIADIFFIIVGMDPLVEWTMNIIRTIDILYDIDVTLFHDDKRISLSLKMISKVLMMDNPEFAAKAAHVLVKLIELCGEHIGAFVQPLVLIFDATMNFTNSDATCRKEFANAVEKLLQKVPGDVVEIMNLAVSSFDEFIQEQVHGVFNILLEEQNYSFVDKFKRFSLDIRRYHVILSDLPQFMEIFRNSF